MDPALHTFLVELGEQVATEGWDQPPRLFALFAIADLQRDAPAAARRLGVAEVDPHATPWTARETPFDAGEGLDDALGQIMWDDEVAGCALVLELLTLPSSTQAELPDDRAAAQRFAADHPDRAELRVVVGVLRDGTRDATVRLRDEFRSDPVLFGADLATGVARILLATFDD
ncbi:MAG TPA: PPA1309 family protein [Sporichthyaceae bacterium]